MGVSEHMAVGSLNESPAAMTIAEWMTRSGVGFGTSGARGLVSAMNDAVCFAYTLGYLRHLESFGEFGAGRPVALAGDLRPSTPRILRACTAAIHHAGGVPVFCGFVPTPALCLYAYGRSTPSLMVTGSHIPSDRNGIKFNRAGGEFLKEDEAGMRVQQVTLPEGRFDEAGMLIDNDPLPEPIDVLSAYTARYADFFGSKALHGLKLAVYQHSAVGRDLLVSVLKSLGAQVIRLGRSEGFVPVDTEAVRQEDRDQARHWALEHEFDALLTTDGDSDRPLLADRQGIWLRGDVLGILAARFLQARAVATPVNSNTALELTGFAEQISRTRIGSPYVVQAMTEAAQKGIAPSVGYEANGGFLLATPVALQGRSLKALPTRDAVLPMLCALVAARGCGDDLTALLETLPPRFTVSDRLAPLASTRSLTGIARLREETLATRSLAPFSASCGPVRRLDETDGLRLIFENNAIVHFRPSGNAPELRVYAEAGNENDAGRLLQMGLALAAPWRD
ncbi:phosphoglucosamine mutase [Asaia spathodeae NBRC 105894]|nr:phosphoglucosamine mutase [Asaia spathodeae NBRC 105894]